MSYIGILLETWLFAKNSLRDDLTHLLEFILTSMDFFSGSKQNQIEELNAYLHALDHSSISVFDK